MSVSSVPIMVPKDIGDLYGFAIPEASFFLSMRLGTD